MCTRENRLEIMYKYALTNELCKNKGKFAELVGVNGSTLSKAFSGEEKYLSDIFMIRVNTALGNVFSLEWVLNGTLPMMKEQHNNTVVIHNDASGDSVRTGNINGDNNVVGTQSNAGNADTTIAQYKRMLADKELLLAEKDKQIAELRKDKENLMQLLTNITTRQ